MSLADRMNGVKDRPGWHYGLGIRHDDGTVDYRLYSSDNRVVEFTWYSHGSKSKLDAACEAIDNFNRILVTELTALVDQLTQLADQKRADNTRSARLRAAALTDGITVIQERIAQLSSETDGLPLP